MNSSPFLQVPKLLFGFGAINGLPAELRTLGVVRPLLVTDRGLISCGTFDQVRMTLREQDPQTFEDTPENPPAMAWNEPTPHIVPVNVMVSLRSAADR